jgi:hypothetical protein
MSTNTLKMISQIGSKKAADISINTAVPGQLLIQNFQNFRLEEK